MQMQIQIQKQPQMQKTNKNDEVITTQPTYTQTYTLVLCNDPFCNKKDCYTYTKYQPSFMSSQLIRQRLFMEFFKENDNDNTSPKKECCYKNIKEHLHSGYCLTSESFTSLEDGICTLIFFPFKIVFCLPCHIGAVVNTILNYCCYTDKNYLCA
jgi:hypothetical protein